MLYKHISAFLVAAAVSLTTGPVWGFSRAPNPEVQHVSSDKTSALLEQLRDLASRDLRDITKAAAARKITPGDLFPPSGQKRAQPNRILAIASSNRAAVFFVGRIATDEPNAAVPWIGYCLGVSGAPYQTEIDNMRPAELGQRAAEICAKAP